MPKAKYNISEQNQEKGMKNFVAFVALIGTGVSFVAGVISLFSGSFLGALGFFFLTAILSGIARGSGA